jgi:hypothetical protein
MDYALHQIYKILPKKPGGNSINVLLPKDGIQCRENTQNQHRTNDKGRRNPKHLRIDFYQHWLCRTLSVGQADHHHQYNKEDKYDGHPVQEWIIRESAVGPVWQLLEQRR